MVLVGVVGAYPPANHMVLVPLVSAGKLRRAVTNEAPVVQLFEVGLYTSTSLEGLGEVLPPPNTYMSPPIDRARVSAVTRGMLVMAVQVFAVGSYLYESEVSCRVVPSHSEPPAVYMRPPIVAAGTYPRCCG